MTKTGKSKKTSIIILSIPPLLNYLDWKKDSANQYFFFTDIINRQEKFATWQQQGNNNLIQWIESLNNEVTASDKVIESLKDADTTGKIILVNYPRNRESLQILEKELWIREQKPPIFFFISFHKQLETDIIEFQNHNVICPLCEKSWTKKVTVSEREGIFHCPEDKTEFNLPEIEKVTQYLLNDYFKRVAQIIEYQKNKKNKIITLELSIKLDLEPENLHKYLLEKLAKEAK